MNLTQLPDLSHEQQTALITLAQRYQTAGYRCLLVGGSVRDLCLGLVPEDFDFATDAPVEASFELFDHVIPTGIAHGTVTVRHQGKFYEITRFRQDLETDGRRAKVLFSQSIEEDLSRRDLTFNAIAFDLLSDQWIDPLGGLADIQNKQIRFVGDPFQRIKEDQLRALRFVRFVFKLQPFGFKADPKEWQAVQAVFDPAPLSIERIYDELGKMLALSVPDPDLWVRWLGKLRPFRAFLPPSEEQVSLRSFFDSGRHTALAVLVAKQNNLTQPPASLRLTRRETKASKLLLSSWDKDLGDPPQLKSFLSQIESTDRAFLSQLFETLTGQPILTEVTRILSAKEPLHLNELLISPRELAALGLQGPHLGQAQRALLSQVWNDPKLNQPTTLKILAQRWIEKGLP